MKRHISGGKTVFRDAKVIDFNYVPEELPHRERQMARLFTLFSPVAASGVSQNAFLFGSVGSGKTATAKRFCLDFKLGAQTQGRGIDFVIVNCRSQHGPEQGIMLRIINHFDERFPDRGFSIAEMLGVLRRHIESRNLHLIIVLDEAEVVLKKSGSNIIYDMSRFDDEKLAAKGSVSLILISQKYVYDLLDEAALSTFKRTNSIEFGRYTEDELLDIAKQRAELAFHPGTVHKSALGLIAEVASEFGDARFAIELLEKSGMLADEEGDELVQPEHVRAAKASIYSSVGEDALFGVGKEKLVLLLAIARAMKNKPYLTTGEIEKSYAGACEEYGEGKRGHTQLWQYMKDLDALGLIDMRKSAEGVSGKTSLVSLTEIPAKVLKEKVEEMLAQTSGKAGMRGRTEED
jgi:cell division control protein 6